MRVSPSQQTLNIGQAETETCDKEKGRTEMATQEGASKGWYLLPIFLGLLGGVIGYVALKGYDHEKAENCLYIGLGVTYVLFWVLISILYG